MKISQMIRELQQIKRNNGDLPVFKYTQDNSEDLSEIKWVGGGVFRAETCGDSKHLRASRSGPVTVLII